MSVQVFESSLNRVLSHTKDKDIAMITAFRTDPKLGYSYNDNFKRNKQLEADLNTLGYKGYVKVVGYWNETPEDPDSKPVKEETFLVLNTGNNSFDEFVKDMTGLQVRYDQQGILIWNHNDQKAYLTDENGNINEANFLSSISIDSLSNAWTQIKNHKISFSECFIDDNFSDRFNANGNFMTAMYYQTKRKSLRNNN